MCGIAGAFELGGGSATPLVATMLRCIRHRGPDGFGFYSGRSIQRAKRLDEIRFDDKSEFAFGHSRLAIVGGQHGIQPFEGCRKGLVIIHNGEIYNHKDLRRRLSKNHRFETATDSETIVHLLEENYDGDLEAALLKTLPELNGVFALVITDGSRMAIARDMLGVKQLYYSVTDELVSFSSERKALWSIGVRDEGERLPPGHFSIISREGMKTVKFQNPPVVQNPQSNTITEFDDAVREYLVALRGAVSKRIEDMGHIGIIFSGGIDSVLVAKLAKDEGADLTCYSAGAEGSGDLSNAQYAASKLGFKIRINRLEERKVQDCIPKIIQTIEDRNLSQVEVALPVYFAVQLAREDGVRVMLTGQAADELFAGYPWYRNVADLEGYKSLRYHMNDDLLRLYKETLEREDKITMAHSIELRVPYLDYDVVRVATRIKTELVLPPGDILGKRVHREAALRCGVPEELAFRKKEAAQHGAGVRGIMEAVAVRNGFREQIVRQSRYSAKESIQEQLGSSQRYGRLYSSESKWETPDNVQMYLDSVALGKRLTSQEDQRLLASVLGRRAA